MSSEDDVRIPVQPTRIGDLGIGSFLVLVGGASLVLCCIGSAFMQQPTRYRFQTLTTAAYGVLIIYLTKAERRSRWEPQKDVISDVDNMWLVRIIVVVIISVGSSLGIFKVFQFDLCGAVVAKEIVSDNEIGRRKKFLF